MSMELNPCHVCGGIGHREYANDDEGDPGVRFVCQNCGFASKAKSSWYAAKLEWNRYGETCHPKRYSIKEATDEQAD